MTADDDDWNRAARGETPTERLDRNWSSLLQELRVVQTGLQLLTGFLLTLPFQTRFTTLDTAETVIYLVTLGCSAVATIVIVAPVAIHRFLFRQHAMAESVRFATRLAITGFLLLGVAITGVVTLIFSVVLDTVSGVVAGACCALAAVILWLVLPARIRSRLPEPEPVPPTTT